MKKLMCAALGLLGLAATSAAAETCGGVYTVQSGDSLSLIADRLYKDVGKWTSIHTGNIKSIGPKPNAIRVGMKLNMTCIDGLPTGLPGGREITSAPVAAQPVKIAQGDASIRHKINLLTGDGYEPFTGKSLHNGGMLTDVVEAAMSKAAPKQGHAIHWVDHWSSHFDPLLSNALLDAGFPWYRPDCESLPDSFRCQNFVFSDPLFELLVLMFADKKRPLTFNTPEDLFGKTFCRPAGYDQDLFNQHGRYWLRDGKIKVVSPLTTTECYEMVLEGKADAVVMNEFTGRTHIKELGLTDQFSVVPQPIALQALHVIVHKTHPEHEEILEMINQGLRDIRKDGTYQSIIEDHLSRIWAGF